MTKKGPRPYHIGRFTHIAAPAPTPDREWREAAYPGDSVIRCDVKRGDEIGSVCIQWYETDKLWVTSYLPGYETSSPGDTPKWNPEHSKWCSSRNEAALEFITQMRRALGDGWIVEHPDKSDIVRALAPLATGGAPEVQSPAD